MSPTSKSLFVTGAGLLLLAGCTPKPADTAPTSPPAATSAPALRSASATTPTPASTSSTAPSKAPGTATAPSKSAPASSPSASPEHLLRAGETAEAKVNGARLTSIRSERSAWKIIVTAVDGTRSGLVVAAKGAPVTSGPRKERDSATERSKNARELETTSIDYTQAVTRLQNTVPGGVVRQLSLDSEDGTSVWQAKVADGRVNRDITLDGVSGDVRSNKVDD